MATADLAIPWGSGGAVITRAELRAAIQAGLVALKVLLRRFLIRIGAKRIIGMFFAAITPEIVSKILLAGLTIWLIWDIIDALTTYWSVSDAIEKYVEELVEEVAEIYSADASPGGPSNEEFLKCVREVIERAIKIAGQFDFSGTGGLPSSLRDYLREQIFKCAGLK
jgi:hypothetical protein